MCQVLFFRRMTRLDAFVLFLLFPALALPMLLLAVAMHDFVDSLAVGPCLYPPLAGLFVPRAALGEYGFLLAYGFPQTVEKNPVVLYPGRIQTGSDRRLEIAGILVAVSPQFFQLGLLGVK